MADELCIHELEKAWCATCKRGARKKPKEVAEIHFSAKYEGQCPSCNFPISIGQRALRTTNGRTLHEDCLT